MPPFQGKPRRFAPILLGGMMVTAVSAAELPGGSDPRAEAQGFEAPRLLRERPAAENPFGFGAAPRAAFQPARLATRLRRSLQQHEALVADGAWDEAIDLVERLRLEAGAELTDRGAASNAGYVTYRPVAVVCQGLLAGLPAEGLAVYRSRREASARAAINDALASLDAERLADLANENLATEAAGDALLALAELALERSDHVAARGWARQASSLLADPLGGPAEVALLRIDPSVDAPTLADAWRADPRPTDTPRALTGDDVLAPAIARLVLASLREGDTRRAAAELRLLEALAPRAEGRLAGRVQPLAPALAELLRLADAAASGSSSPGRAADLAWAWREAAAIEKPIDPVGPPLEMQRGFQLNALGQFVPIDALPSPAVQPAFARHVAVDARHGYFVEEGELRRVDLATGEKSVVEVPRASVSKDPANSSPTIDDVANGRLLGMNRVVIGGGFRVQGLAGGRRFVQMFPGATASAATPTASRLDPHIAVAQGKVYVRVVEAQRLARDPHGGLAATTEEALVALPVEGAPPEIASERLRFLPPAVAEGEARPGAVGYQFASPPAVRGDRLYVVVARPGARTDIALACYHAATTRLLWKSDLGVGEPAASPIGPRVAAPLVAGDAVYVATDLGAVAACEASTGTLRWLAVYPRSTDASRGATPAPPTPPVLAGDRLLVAPSDSAEIAAYDAWSGRLVWSTPKPADAALVGVVRRAGAAVAVVAGSRVECFDVLTGGRLVSWPESARAGVRGRGRAAIVAGEVFWPIRGAIVALDPLTGAPTRPPIDLTPVAPDGASLLATDLGLLVCGAERLRLLAGLDQDN